MILVIPTIVCVVLDVLVRSTIPRLAPPIAAVAVTVVITLLLILVVVRARVVRILMRRSRVDTVLRLKRGCARCFKIARGTRPLLPVLTPVRVHRGSRLKLFLFLRVL